MLDLSSMASPEMMGTDAGMQDESGGYHANEGLAADGAGVVHCGQADVRAVRDARVRGLRPDCACPYRPLAEAALKASCMPPASQNIVRTSPQSVRGMLLRPSRC